MASAAKPASMPNPVPAIVLITANSRPSRAAVRMNISVSMIGEAMQKARTGAIGTPAISRLATSGTTPHTRRARRAGRRRRALDGATCSRV